MPALFEILYREYCRARLAEMRKQLLTSPERHEAPEAICDANDAVGTNEASGGGLRAGTAVPLGRGRRKKTPAMEDGDRPSSVVEPRDCRQAAWRVDRSHTGRGKFTEFKVILPRIAVTGKAGADK